MEYPDNMDEKGLPYPKFELMQEVDDKSEEYIKFEVFEGVRKCALKMIWASKTPADNTE